MVHYSRARLRTKAKIFYLKALSGVCDASMSEVQLFTDLIVFSTQLSFS